MMTSVPVQVTELAREGARIGFDRNSVPAVGSLLLALSASKPGGRLLELGTGIGMGSAWILAGMDASAHLDSVDQDSEVQAVARKVVSDPRVTFHESDAGAFLETVAGSSYDLIFADAWPGKFTHLELVLSKLDVGGIYLIDDLTPVSSWPAGHDVKVTSLVKQLRDRPGFAAVELPVGSGVMLLVRTDAV